MYVYINVQEEGPSKDALVPSEVLYALEQALKKTILKGLALCGLAITLAGGCLKIDFGTSKLDLARQLKLLQKLHLREPLKGSTTCQ